MSFTVEELVGLMGSYSRVFTLPAQARDRLLARVESEASRHLAESGGSTVELAMRCHCWRVTKD